MGNDTNAPKAAAPIVNIRRNGPSASALNEEVVGPVRMAANAERPPAIPHVTRLTRDTEIPQSRAASGFPAADADLLAEGRELKEDGEEGEEYGNCDQCQ